jgi:hypothetical protein
MYVKRLEDEFSQHNNIRPLMLRSVCQSIVLSDIVLSTPLKCIQSSRKLGEKIAISVGGNCKVQNLRRDTRKGSYDA